MACISLEYKKVLETLLSSPADKSVISAVVSSWEVCSKDSQAIAGLNPKAVEALVALGSILRKPKEKTPSETKPMPKIIEAAPGIFFERK